MLKHLSNIILLMAFWLPAITCNMKPNANNSSSNKQDRIQRIINRDSEGRIVKTFDGFIYRIFDTLGRQVEWYGNYNNDESKSNIHNFVEYSDSVIIARQYVLEDGNKECEIIDKLDCSISKYYYDRGKLIRREGLIPERDNKDKIIGHQLVGTGDNPRINPFIHKLPSYLK